MQTPRHTASLLSALCLALCAILLAAACRREQTDSVAENLRDTTALQLYGEAYLTARNMNDTAGIVRSLNDIGGLFQHIGWMEQAARYFRQACDYGQISADTSRAMLRNIVSSQENLAEAYRSLGRHTEARICLRRALAGEIKLTDKAGQARSYARLGVILQNEGKADSARMCYNRAMKWSTALHSEKDMARCHLLYGGLHEEAGRYAKAIGEYETAYLLMSGSKDPGAYLDACIALARAYKQRKSTGTAMEYLQEAQRTAEDIPSATHLAQIHQLYYDIYLHAGNYRKALNSYTNLRRWRDSIDNIALIKEAGLRHAAWLDQCHQAQTRAMEQSLAHEHKWRMVCMWLLIAVAATLSGAGAHYLRKRGK